MPPQSLAERPRRLLMAGLIGLVAVLAVYNVYLLRTTIDISPSATLPAKDTTNPKSAGALATALDKKPVTAFPETASRPLFNADRKPVERVKAPEPVQSVPQNLRLLGIMQTGNGPKRALIRAAADARGTWVHEGDQVAGWTLRSIGDRSIMLVNGGRTYELAIATRREPAQR